MDADTRPVRCKVIDGSGERTGNGQLVMAEVFELNGP